MTFRPHRIHHIPSLSPPPRGTPCPIDSTSSRSLLSSRLSALYTRGSAIGAVHKWYDDQRGGWDEVRPLVTLPSGVCHVRTTTHGRDFFWRVNWSTNKKHLMLIQTKEHVEDGKEGREMTQRRRYRLQSPFEMCVVS